MIQNINSLWSTHKIQVTIIDFILLLGFGF